MSLLFLPAFFCIPGFLAVLSGFIVQQIQSVESFLIAGCIGLLVSTILVSLFVARFGHHSFFVTQSKSFRVGLYILSMISYITLYSGLSYPTEQIDFTSF